MFAINADISKYLLTAAKTELGDNINIVNIDFKVASHLPEEGFTTFFVSREAASITDSKEYALNIEN